MKKNDNDGNVILLTVIGIATLLVALVGATFAFFTATINVKSVESVIVTSGRPVALTYIGKDLRLINAIPGETAGLNEKTKDSGTFIIQNIDHTGLSDVNLHVPQVYDLDFEIDNNTFTIIHPYVKGESGYIAGAETQATTERPNQLLINISGNRGINDNESINILNSKFDVTDGDDKAKAGTKIPLVRNQIIDYGETQTYSMNLEFAELNLNQDENRSAKFSGHVNLSNAHTIKD